MSGDAPPPLPPDPYAIPERQSEFGRLIPTSNPASLWSYYLGIFSLIPLLGAPMGVAAVIFGVKGLARAKADPQHRGRTHSWVGIICGGLFGAISLTLIVLLVVGVMSSRGR